MVPGIWSTTDIIFCHSGTFFAFLPPLWTQKIKIFKKNGKTPEGCMVPGILSATDRIFCHFGLFFVLLPPKNQPEKSKFEKIKKIPRDIILQMCTINENDMMYGS